MPDRSSDMAKTSDDDLPDIKELNADERLYYRDELRSARYAALADLEGFHEICFALESLGLRLHGRKADLGTYRRRLKQFSKDSVVLSELTQHFPSTFTQFDALFDLVRTARNDAMHTGVYARHATAAAIELCIGLEEAVMKETQMARRLVEDYMVKSPVIVQSWQPVAHARQLMLTHSFSFLPVEVDGWKLVSETCMAHYIQSVPKRSEKLVDLLAFSIHAAQDRGLRLIDAQVVGLKDEVHSLLDELTRDKDIESRLWLVVDDAKHLCGVLSPFELM